VAVDFEYYSGKGLRISIQCFSVSFAKYLMIMVSASLFLHFCTFLTQTRRLREILIYSYVMNQKKYIAPTCNIPLNIIYYIYLLIRVKILLYEETQHGHYVVSFSK
jgi:hypothetical protein